MPPLAQVQTQVSSLSLDSKGKGKEDGGEEVDRERGMWNRERWERVGWGAGGGEGSGGGTGTAGGMGGEGGVGKGKRRLGAPGFEAVVKEVSRSCCFPVL